MTLISPHCPPISSCICLAKMGSGASGFALYWNCLVCVNTSDPFRARTSCGGSVHPWLSRLFLPLFPQRGFANRRSWMGRRSFVLFSPECVEVEFCELPLNGVLRTSSCSSRVTSSLL